ncbi:putative nucleoporin [Protomyces lactucae-debilis]|uniref:Putative nucleoporin n=1 Tax=Protomyces lactucae-debilis TaxID=2754530 RepID=A0A1Y2EZB4_PROLT|nr:putative nucleoporin [Protomyces lactucae-debilis]ORY76962.1 putative nucleoporin [Protomyces lactucae-debilis]
MPSQVQVQRQQHAQSPAQATGAAVQKPQQQQQQQQQGQGQVSSQQQQQQQPQAIQPQQSARAAALTRGNQAINQCLAQDQAWPELGDILSQGSSTEYTWQTAPAWQPFARSEIVNIPDTIFEQYNSTECYTQMGLFGDIQRAWITVDNRLYLWNYADGQDFQAYEDHPHTLTAVALVRPRGGVFVDAITHLLVLATPYDILLLGVASPKNHKGEMQFYATRMSVPVTGIDVNCICSTDSGRIFFAGKADAHVYELRYQADEGWFSRRCSKVNLTGSAFDNFIPALATKATEHLVQLVVDNSRKLLYTLSSKSTIRAYAIEEPASLSLCATYTISSAASHAQMINAASPLLDPRSTSIVSLCPIPASDSKQIYLVAVTSTGCRLYMRSSASGFNSASARMSSLQVSHVRYPPAPHTQTPRAPPQLSLTAPNALPAPNAQSSQTAQTSQVLANTTRAQLFSPHLFFDVAKSNDPATPGDRLLGCAPEADKLALQFSAGNTRPLLSESCCWLPIEGFVQDVCAIQQASSTASGIGAELITQFTLPPASFAVLTNTGVHIIKRRRTTEVFASALRHAPSAAGGIEAEMRLFFENIGRAEGCATCLGVICGGLDGTDVDEATAGGIQYNSRLTASQVLETSRRYFIEFGGKAFVDENLHRHFADAGQATLPTLEMVRLSGRHDGVALYVARTVASFWRLPIMRQIVPGEYVSSLSESTLQTVQSRIISLRQFLEANKHAIEGLAGPERLLGTTNRQEEIVLQAEHRGMHALLTLIVQIIECLSFIQVLSDSPEGKMTDILRSVPPAVQQDAIKLTFEELLTSQKGQDIAKELVTAIVNRRIAQGGTVESVSETLQKRCGSFCSSDDVVLYKAIEQLKRARDAPTVGERERILRECLRLFQHAAATLSLDNLRDTMEEFEQMQFYAGALELAFSVAHASDPSDVALGYMQDGKPENDARAAFFAKREQCYTFMFATLDKLEGAFAAQDSAYAGSSHVSPLSSLRDAAYAVIGSSSDALFHNLFYDWYVSRNLQERLLEISSPFIEPYLRRKAQSSLAFANLLWHYHARRQAYLDAAKVLHNISRSGYDLPLEQRIEYLSQAKSFLACVATQDGAAQLLEVISEELDVMGIQDDLLNSLRNDTRLREDKKAELIAKLDGKLVPLTDLFNQFADPLGYGEVCLAIFQAAGYRGTLEIRSCWEKLLEREHELADEQGGPAPFERVGNKVRQLGRRFGADEVVFSLEELLPMLERYHLQRQKGEAPRGWAVEVLLEAEAPHEALFAVLEDLYLQPAWQAKQATVHLIGETLALLLRWVEVSMRPGTLRYYDTPGQSFPVERASDALKRSERLLGNAQGAVASELRIETQKLQRRIRDM